MAKKRRNTKKKHNNEQEQNSSEFLADVPESSADEWSGQDEVVDPYAEQFEQRAQEEAPQSEPHSEPIYEEEPFEEEPQQDYPPEGIQDVHPTEEHVQDAGNSFSLGNFLRDQREQQGISLKNVSQSTKISLTNLEYLEEDDLHSLPDRAYVTGYVKSYAKLLGSDVNFCLDLLDKTYQAQGASPREPEIVIPQAQNSPKISQGFPVAKIAAVAAMIIIIVGVVGFFMTRDSSPEPKVAMEEEVELEEEKEITPQTLNAETPLQEELSQQEEEPSLEDDISDSDDIDPQPVVAQKKEEPKEGPKKPEAKPEPPKEVVVKEEEEKEKKEEKTAEAENNEEKEKRKFYPLSDQLYSEDTSLSQEKINELLPSQFRVSPVDGIQAVFITAVKGDSWLTYKSDDDPIKKFVLKEGRSLLFRAKEARVFLGNLGAVKIFLNNKPLRVTSRTGVKSLVFPQENSSKYVMPLFIYKEDGTVQTSKEWIDENE